MRRRRRNVKENRGEGEERSRLGGEGEVEERWRKREGERRNEYKKERVRSRRKKEEKMMSRRKEEDALECTLYGTYVYLSILMNGREVYISLFGMGQK